MQFQVFVKAVAAIPLIPSGLGCSSWLLLSSAQPQTLNLRPWCRGDCLLFPCLPSAIAHVETLNLKPLCLDCLSVSAETSLPKLNPQPKALFTRYCRNLIKKPWPYTVIPIKLETGLRDSLYITLRIDAIGFPTFWLLL